VTLLAGLPSIKAASKVFAHPLKSVTMTSYLGSGSGVRLRLG
jgi:hypothetical protein